MESMEVAKHLFNVYSQKLLYLSQLRKEIHFPKIELCKLLTIVLLKDYACSTLLHSVSAKFLRDKISMDNMCLGP